MSIWHAQGISAAWFVDPSHQADLGPLFEALTGFKAATIQSSQVFMPSPVTTGFAQGATGNCAYVLQINPGRIDFAMSPTAGKDAFVDTEKRIDEMASHVTGHGVSLVANRLAFIVNLVQDATDLPAANTAMREQIDLGYPLDADQDFMFRINRRSIVGGRECNRLLTWAVGQMQNIQIVISVHPMAAASPLPAAPLAASGATRFAALASIDLNTVVDPGTTFSVSDQQTILVALAKEALRLCRENRLDALT